MIMGAIVLDVKRCKITIMGAIIIIIIFPQENQKVVSSTKSSNCDVADCTMKT